MRSYNVSLSFLEDKYFSSNKNYCFKLNELLDKVKNHIYLQILSCNYRYAVSKKKSEISACVVLYIAATLKKH